MRKIADFFSRSASNSLWIPEGPEPDIGIEQILHAFFFAFLRDNRLDSGLRLTGEVTPGISA